MDEFWRHRVKRNKPDAQGHMLYGSTEMRYLEDPTQGDGRWNGVAGLMGRIGGVHGAPTSSFGRQTSLAGWSESHNDVSVLNATKSDT